MKKHNWQITDNENEADYHVYSTVVMCRNNKNEENSIWNNNHNYNHASVSASAIGAGAGTMQYNYGIGTAMMVTGLFLGSNKRKTREPIYVGYKNRVTVYEPKTGKKIFKYIKSESHSPATIHDVDAFASGIFY